MLSNNDSVPNPYSNNCEPSAKWGGNSDDDEITQDSERRIVVYPNPAKSRLSVEMHLNDGERARIELWSITGARVKNSTLGSGKSDIDISELGSGIYFYTIFIDGLHQKAGKQIIIK